MPDALLAAHPTHPIHTPCSDTSAKCWYSITLVTSDLRGAGTDADVHVQLVGAAGSSERTVLASTPEQFERGSRDTFR
jgi:hypothetical protein